MKIGILTYHRALNYGAVLQCYALYITIRSLGHDVEVIDYRPDTIERYRMYFRWRDFGAAKGIIGKIKYVVSSIQLIHSKQRTSKKFDEFLTKNFKLSKLVTSGNDIPQNYDVIVFGSDQIWSPENNEGIDNVYLGDFEHNRTKFITYAISAGHENLISTIYYDNYKNSIKNFDSISVREISLQKCLESKFFVKSEVVCDPSLFLTEEECSRIALQPKDDHYVLVFNLVNDLNIVRMAREIAEDLKCKVIEIKAVANPCHIYPFELHSKLSPAEFLGFVKYADCIITNSFHTTSFSIIMHKNFYTTLRLNNNDRAKTLLKVAGLSERQVDAKQKQKFSAIDYNGVDERLSAYRAKSLEYLRRNL